MMVSTCFKEKLGFHCVGYFAAVKNKYWVWKVTGYMAMAKDGQESRQRRLGNHLQNLWH